VAIVQEKKYFYQLYMLFSYVSSCHQYTETTLDVDYH